MSDPDSVVKDGILQPEIVKTLALISMFKPLSAVPGIEELVMKLDLSKAEPLLAALITKSILEPAEEEDMAETFESLTGEIKWNLIRL